WDELLHHLITYGGSLVTLLFKRPGPERETPGIFHGYFTGPIPTAVAYAPIPFPDRLAPQSPVPAGTGPP
ncbi:MAG: hypothetical protein ACREF3_15765, partial [Acetobacteraceae bacterium]